MKNLVIVLLLFCGIGICSTPTESEQKLFIEKCLKPTIMLESYDETTSGTGVIVKSEKLKFVDAYFNIVFSCEHILKSNKQTIKISDYDENGIFKKYKNSKAIVFYKDRDNDISILFFTSEKQMPVADCNFNYIPKLRDDVFAIGHGMGDQARYSDGRVTGALKSKETFVEYKTSVPIIFGDSGGPLFYKNKLIGITNSMRSMKVSDNLKVPVYNISTFKSLILFNNILKETGLSKEMLTDVEIPEIVGVDIWLKDQKEIFK